MPLYEYQCSKCGNVFEVIQKFSDAPLTVHEGCGGEVVKLISRSAFQLKGSGWYATDYARGSASKTDGKGDSGKADSDKNASSKSDANKNDSGKSESGNSDTKSESKSDTKSETKSESKSESKPAPVSGKSE
jgi:putative FmdB family regulatory protein